MNRLGKIMTHYSIGKKYLIKVVLFFVPQTLWLLQLQINTNGYDDLIQARKGLLQICHNVAVRNDVLRFDHSIFLYSMLY